METQREFPTRLSQLLILLTVAGVFPGQVAVFRGILLLQKFFLLQHCPLANASGSNACCPHCLGLSEFEYGWSAGAPNWLAIPFVFLSGAAVDRLGLPVSCIALSLLAVTGSVLLLLASYALRYHALVLLLLSLGRGVTVVTGAVGLSLRSYICTRFWAPKLQPFILGFMYALWTPGALFGSLVYPRLAEWCGLRVTFWTSTIVTGVSLTFSLCWIPIFKLRPDVTYLEDQLTAKKAAQLEDSGSSLRVVIASLGSFVCEYWLIATVIATMLAIREAQATNVELLLNSLLSLPAVTVADY